jgi:hypothetical protein
MMVAYTVEIRLTDEQLAEAVKLYFEEQTGEPMRDFAIHKLTHKDSTSEYTDFYFTSSREVKP